MDNLTIGQKAFMALQELPQEEVEARKRQAHGETWPGKKKNPGVITSRNPTAVEIIGKKYGLAGQTLQQAKYISNNSLELSELVINGDISLNAAYQLCKSPIKKAGVYLIGPEIGSGPIKIGISAYGPEYRLKRLQTGNWIKLKIINWFPCSDPKSTESMLHDRYRSRHIHGEWFNLVQEDLLDIAQLIKGD